MNKIDLKSKDILNCKIKVNFSCKTPKAVQQTKTEQEWDGFQTTNCLKNA